MQGIVVNPSMENLQLSIHTFNTTTVHQGCLTDAVGVCLCVCVCVCVCVHFCINTETEKIQLESNMNKTTLFCRTKEKGKTSVHICLCTMLIYPQCHNHVRRNTENASIFVYDKSIFEGNDTKQSKIKKYAEGLRMNHIETEGERQRGAGKQQIVLE